MKVIDASNEAKTASVLLGHIIDVIHLLEETWHVRVVAEATDASGESRRARKDLLVLRPNLVTPDCFTHQVSLIHRHI